jgi:hypothetical protein
LSLSQIWEKENEDSPYFKPLFIRLNN